MKKIDLNNLPKGYKVFDVADYLKTEKDISGFLEACFEEGGDDPAYMSRAFNAVARARGMAKLAKKAGLTQSFLRNAFSNTATLDFPTILKVINALGLKLKMA